MLYFSELFNEKVYTQDKTYIGRIKDVVFIPLKTPLITKLLVKGRGDKEYFFPIKQVKRNGVGFIVSDITNTEKIQKNESLILEELQNQQIIDINGTKVIRVNDIVISNTPEYVISGLDIGVLGVFRWIGLSRIVAAILHLFNIHPKSQFVPWSEIDTDEMQQGRIVLKKEQEKLEKMLPEDLAEHLEQATISNVEEALEVMDPDLSARVIADLNLDYQTALFLRFPPERSANILALIDPDEAVDVLLTLEPELRELVIKHIPAKKRKPIEYLLQYAKTPIGHLMTTDVISVSSDATVRNIFEKIKKISQDFSDVYYLYVVNRQEQIVGVLSIHELILHKLDVPVYKIMNQNLILGRLTTPKEIMIKRMVKYHLHAMPIVDEQRKMLGTVSLLDLVEVVFEKEVE